VTRALALAALLAATACGRDGNGGVEPFEFTACGSDVDDGIDGSIDSAWIYEYDTFGYPTFDRRDDGDDGVVEAVVSYDYESGDLLGYDEDEGFDGDVEYAWSATYDDHRKQTEAEDADGDDLIDSASTWRYEGDQISTVEVDQAEAGMMVDGAIDQRHTYFYQGDDVDRIDSDFDLDGTRDAVTTYEYNGDGDAVAQHIDYGDDGADDYVYTWEYDGAGHVTRSTIDLDASTAELDFTVSYTWSGDDLQTAERTSGLSSSLETYLYDCAAP
jgi:hypothetical protein